MLPGVDLEHVLTSWDVLGQHRAVGKRVVVYDEQSGPYTEMIALFLAKRDHMVTIVTRLPQFGLNTPAPNLGTQLRRMYSAGIRFKVLTLISEIRRDSLVLEHAVTREREIYDDVDSVVLDALPQGERHALPRIEGERSDTFPRRRRRRAARNSRRGLRKP